MLTEQQLQEHKKLIEERNKCAQEKNILIDRANEKKKHGLEIMKSYGYTSLQEISKLKEDVAKYEQILTEERKEAEQVITEHAALKQKLDESLVK